MRRRMIFIAPLAIVGILLFVTIGGAVVQFLWNWLLPPLFGWPALTFWQALALLALCRILFGGVAARGARPGYAMRGAIRRRVAQRFAARWETMTPEERERVRERMRARCGFDPAATDSKPAQ